MPSHNNLAFRDEMNSDCFTSNRRPRLEPQNIRTSRLSNYLTVSDRPRGAYVSVLLLCLINLINYMDRSTLAGVLEDVQRFYSISNTEGGLLQTSFIVSYMIMAPVFGYLGDRYNRRNIIACGVTFWSITTLLGSFIPQNHFGSFIFLRALVGTGEASYSTIAPTIIADLFSNDQRSKMLAFFYFAIPVGSGLGYIVGSQISSALGSWQWSLRVTPGIGFLSVILALLFLREPPRGESEGSSVIHVTSIQKDLMDLSKIKSFVWSTFGFTCVTFATGALAWWGPKYMKYAMELEHHKTSHLNASLAFGIITCIAGILGVVSGSYASQRLRRINPKADPLICAFGVLICIPFAFTGLVIANKHVAIAWTLIFIAEVFLCMNWTIIADILLYVIIPTRRSMAEAVQILTSHALGDASSPYICGIIADVLLDGSTSTIDNYTSLQYALYLPVIVLVFAIFFFFNTALHIEKDKRECSFITRGLVPPLHILADDFLYPEPVQLAADDVWPEDRTYLV